MHFLKNKKYSSFWKALIVPFFLFLLSFIPNIKEIYEWLELKTLDGFFVFYPEICQLTGKEPVYDASTAIITKDQSLEIIVKDKFHRSVNRSDFAKVLKSLKKQGVKVAGLDFIYSDAASEEEDKEFIESLDEFPYPILGQNFTRRGSQDNFSLVDIKVDDAERPAGFVNLHRPISEKAFARGVINTLSDVDLVVRFAPLAYHPLTGNNDSEDDMYQPTMGFAAWIISLLAENENELNEIDFSKAENLTEAFKIIRNAAPYDFHSTGHDGLDRIILNLETNFIYKKVIKLSPNFKITNFNELIEFYKSQSKIKTKTWAKLPRKPLPLIGTKDTPCIRLPFQKLAFPFNGDGIETRSMSHFIDSDEDVNSVYMFSKNKYNISAEELNQKLMPEIPTTYSGNNNLFGEVKTITGEPITNASVWAIMTQTGYWEKAKTDKDGKYHLANLPFGDCIINVFVNSYNGWDKAMLSVKIDKNEQNIPLLLLAENTNKLDLSTYTLPRSSDAEMWIHGEITPMIYSNDEGYVGIKNLPDGYSILSLDDNESEEEENFALSEEGNLLLNGNLCKKRVAAILSNEDNWQKHYYRKIKLNKNENLIINDLPPSLATEIFITSKTGLFSKPDKKVIEIKPGLPIELEDLPRVFLDFTSSINLKLDFLSNPKGDCKAILLSDSGKEYVLNNKDTLAVPNGDYFVLTEFGNSRGWFKQASINKKTVFIGTALSTDQDFVVAPINYLDKGFTKIPGVNIHANLFSALKNQRFFYAPPFHMDRASNAWPFYQFLLVLPIFALLSVKFKNANSIKSTFLIITIIGTIFLTAMFCFPNRILVPVFYPCMLIFNFGITRGFVEWINYRKQAAQTQSAFSRFISSEIVAQIVKNPDSIKPGGEKKELTIMFTDIAGFTSISEKLDAEALTDLMNSYLDEMTKILFKYSGTLDKYVGDAIMGFWNHPTLQEDHTSKAVACAIRMQKKLKEMREKWIAQGLPKVEMRAGINTGVCMVGFVGSKIQMNFTCLGDNVNLASRLEGANKAYGTNIMISQAVKDKLTPDTFSIRFLDFLAVKGKNEPVLVYEVRGLLSEETEIWLEKAGDIYQKGINKYLAREWDEAIELFNEVLKLVPDDSPSKVYIDRCNHYKKEPPEENWDGRFVLKTK